MGNTNNKKIYKILSIIILFIMLSILFKYANSQSFWIDELDWTVDYLENSNNYIELFQSLIKAGFNLPLYYLIVFPIYKIAPFGELWLLIPNFIAIIVGIYILNKTGNKIEKNLGFASLLMAATSYTLIVHCAFEFRPYAFLFTFSTYVLYRYICRLQDPKKRSNIFLYALSIILLAYTHWFGCLIIVFYFLVDVFLWLRKKHTISFIIPYIALGIAFLPYFIMMMLNHTTNFVNYWARRPTFKKLLYGELGFLLSNNIICKLLFVAGIIILLTYIFRKNKRQNIDKNIILVLFGCIAWTLGTIFIYSKFINPNGSLWVSRYFLVLLPHLFIITSIPIAKLLSISSNIQIKSKTTDEISIKKIFILYIIILSIVMIGCINYQKVHIFENSLDEPYREISELIANTPAVYEENCALLVSSGRGYLTYYFEKKGVKLPCNVFEANTEGSLTQDNMTQCVKEGKLINSSNADLEDLLNYDKLYVCRVHKSFRREITSFLNENYDCYLVDQTLRVYLCTKNNENFKYELTDLTL